MQVMKSIDFAKHSDSVPSQKGYGVGVTYAYSQAILTTYLHMVSRSLSHVFMLIYLLHGYLSHTFLRSSQNNLKTGKLFN